MSEKFNLKWTDYQSNWNRSLSELRNDSDLADVTLISDDKVKFSAHKIVLSSCSNMFKFILKGNTHANPLLYLGGISSINLGLILDYIYHGEVNLSQEQLDSFLGCAQKLELEGVIGYNNDEQEIDEDGENMVALKREVVELDEERKMVNVDQTNTTIRHCSRASASITFNNDINTDVRSMTPEEIEKKTRELYERKDGVWICLICGYVSLSSSSTVRKHVETHLEGLSYTCAMCSKVFRTRNALYKHNGKVHKVLHISRVKSNSNN